MAQYSYSDTPQKTALASTLPFLDVDHNPGASVIVHKERVRMSKGGDVSRCYLMRKYHVTDKEAREIMCEITGDDRQTTMGKDG